MRRREPHRDRPYELGGLANSVGFASHSGVLAASTIKAPSIEYGQLAPMLVVFGAALVGVLVEAFAPRGCAAAACTWC